MSIEDLKQEASSLSFEDQGKLAAFLVSIRAAKDPNHRSTLARRIDDKNPDHWISLNEFEAGLPDE